MTDDLLGYLLLADVLQLVPGDVLQFCWRWRDGCGRRCYCGRPHRKALTCDAPQARGGGWQSHRWRRSEVQNGAISLSELCCQRRRVFRSKRADVGVALLEAWDGFV